MDGYKLISWVFVFCIFLSISLATDLTGYVRDADGAPLPFATVRVIETSEGAYTDESGYFIIPDSVANPPYELEISYIGYESVRAQGTPGGINTITLRQEAIALEETVIRAPRPKLQAVLKASIVNDIENFFGNCDFNCKEDKIYLHPGDYIEFNGVESNYDGGQLLSSQFTWYFFEDGSLLQDEIDRNLGLGEFISFLVDYKTSNPEDVVRNTKIETRSFDLSGFGRKNQIALLEVKRGDDYNFYIQPIDVDSLNQQFCTPESPCVEEGIAETPREEGLVTVVDISETGMDAKEIRELGNKLCNKDSDCAPWQCNQDIKSCSPSLTNYEHLHCLASFRSAQIYDEDRNLVDNPFFWSELFPQTAKLRDSPTIAKARCEGNQIVIPFCASRGTIGWLPPKDCPSGTSCNLNERGIGVCMVGSPTAPTQEPESLSFKLGHFVSFRNPPLEDFDTMTLSIPEEEFLLEAICSDADISMFTYIPGEEREIVESETPIAAVIKPLTGYFSKITGMSTPGRLTGSDSRYEADIENIHNNLANLEDPYATTNYGSRARFLNVKLGTALMKSFGYADYADLNSVIYENRDKNIAKKDDNLEIKKQGFRFDYAFRQFSEREDVRDEGIDYTPSEDVDVTDFWTSIQFLVVETKEDRCFKIDGKEQAINAGFYFVPYPMDDRVTEDMIENCEAKEEGAFELVDEEGRKYVMLDAYQGAQLMSYIPAGTDLRTLEGSDSNYFIIVLARDKGEFSKGVNYLAPMGEDGESLVRDVSDTVNERTSSSSRKLVLGGRTETVSLDSSAISAVSDYFVGKGGSFLRKIGSWSFKLSPGRGS